MLSQMLKENKGYKTFPGIIPKQSACQITIDMGGGNRLFNVVRCAVIVYIRGWSGGRGEKLNGNYLTFYTHEIHRMSRR
jgi:hypothetical protein